MTTFLAVAAVLLGLGSGGVETGTDAIPAALDHRMAQPLVPGTPQACIDKIPWVAADGNGYLVMTARPALAGIQVIVAGDPHVTDEDGCVIVELPFGEYSSVEVVRDEEGEARQLLDGVVRPVAGRWLLPVVIGEVPTEVEIAVGPPICALLPPLDAPQPLTGSGSTGLLAISTVPRTPGVLVNIDGHEMASDEEGCLVVPLPRGVYSLSVPDVYQSDDSTRIVFGRWNDTWDIERNVRIGSGATEMQLGVKIQHPVQIDFFDASLDPLDLSRIESATLVNSFGETFPLSEKSFEADEAISFDDVWLSANRLRRVSSGLLSDNNIYVFRDVFVDGENVVQSSEIDYIPAITRRCPELSAAMPQRCASWRVRLLLFPFEVALRSFIFQQPVEANVEVYVLNAGEGELPVLTSETDETGTVVWSQVPRGDYEIRVSGGGISTTTPTIVTGPKVEQITVMTRDVLWFVLPMGLLMLLTVILFVRKPRWRLALAALWPVVIGFVLSVPSLGAALNRPLSATVVATYTSDGDFVGIEAEVSNGSSLPVDQAYCAPDFELRIPGADGIWSATFESPDFHDVEMSRDCRTHRVAPGTSREIFTSTQGQEWNVSGELPAPGVYEAFVRVFNVPAGAIDIDLRQGFAPFLSFAPEERPDVDDIPFTNPFED